MLKLHKYQQEILKLAQTKNINELSLRKLGQYIGISHPQQVKFHLEKLYKNGLLSRSSDINTSLLNEQLTIINIPILGEANCGKATLVAEQRENGYLTLSSKLLKKKRGIFALKAVGNSMNKAIISGNNIENGDYVIVDETNKNPNNNDIVVSIINGCANIKKFLHETEKNRISLISESTEDFPPIYIHEDDFDGYFINGVVIQVIKK